MRRSARSPNPSESLAGSLLLAHPGLQDPNFRRTVVLISAHSTSDGAMGVVLNRPLGKSLGEIREDLLHSPIADTPVYLGGPVAPDALILTAWKTSGEIPVFRMFFGVTAEALASMQAADPDLQARAFLGYSGWEAGQLEAELGGHSWVVAPIQVEALRHPANSSVWREALIQVRPSLSFLAAGPDDPLLN